MARTCVVNLDTLITIAKASLQMRLASLSPEKLQAVHATLRFALGLEQ